MPTAAAEAPPVKEEYVIPPELMPDYDSIVTEDDTPVDNMFSEKQQRLLTEPLYSSWKPGEPFLAMANVGLFYKLKEPPLVPDMMLALGVVTPPGKIHEKQNRSYFVWEIGKAPEAVIEVVSNKEGGEADCKLAIYANMGIPYYVIFDPERHIQTADLLVYQLLGRQYQEMPLHFFPQVGLGLTLWKGTFENYEDTFLRWCNDDGSLILTGAELAAEEKRRADDEQRRADSEQHRADSEQRRAEDEKRRADKLARKLRELGVDPDAL